MLSTAAFNALLKTLEEPPPHVKFVFATTEVQKVLPTILSRCQRFDLKPIPDDLIIKRLKAIAESEKVKVDAGARLHRAARRRRHARRPVDPRPDDLILRRRDRRGRRARRLRARGGGQGRRAGRGARRGRPPPDRRDRGRVRLGGPGPCPAPDRPAGAGARRRCWNRSRGRAQRPAGGRPDDDRAADAPPRRAPRGRGERQAGPRREDQFRGHAAQGRGGEPGPGDRQPHQGARLARRRSRGAPPATKKKRAD
jgi:hypothetical protein